MKRVAQPELSAMGELVLSHYEQHLCVEEDLSAATFRNYLSALRQFAAWCEASWQQGHEHASPFTPEKVATPTLIEYRTYLQYMLQVKPTPVNRALVTLKCYFAWLVAWGKLTYDQAKMVKLMSMEAIPPCHLDDQEEQALVASVTKGDAHETRPFSCSIRDYVCEKFAPSPVRMSDAASEAERLPCMASETSIVRSPELNRASGPPNL